jgi:hypothetical protein
MAQLGSRTQHGWDLAGKRVKHALNIRDRATAWDSGRTWMRLKYLVVAMAALLVAVAWKPVQRDLAGYLTANHVHAVRWQQVTLINAPSWMPSPLKAELQNIVAMRVSSDPMNHESLEAAVSALVASPWVAGVDRLERRDDGVAVSARFRKPAAMVQLDQVFRLIDAQGILLPGEYGAEHAARLGLPTIAHVQAAMPRPGALWPGDDVQAGLAMSRLIPDPALTRQVLAIDVGQRDPMGRLKLALVTARGQVCWGLPPGQEKMIESPADMKLSWLRRINETYGSIDAGGGAVDLSGPAAVVHVQPQQTTRVAAARR